MRKIVTTSRWPILLAGLCLVLASCAAYQTVAPAEPTTPSCVAETAPPELLKQPGYRQIIVTVEDGKGGPPSKLSRDDLRLSLGDKPVPIEFFQQHTLSVGVLVDTSASMERKLPQAQAAITEFIHHLNQRDYLFLIAFSDRAFLLQPLSTNHDIVLSRLDLLHAYGQTALYDTIAKGLLMIQHGNGCRKALFLITDGIDNTSQSTVSEIEKQARKEEVLIFSIGIGDPNVKNPFLAAGDLNVDTKTLTALAKTTGAKTYLVREVEDGELLKETAAEIAEEIGNQYSIGFVTTGAPGNPLRLELQNHKDLSLKLQGPSEDVIVAPR